MPADLVHRQRPRRAPGPGPRIGGLLVAAVLCVLALPGLAGDASAPWRVHGQATMRFLGLAIYDAVLSVPADFKPEAWTRQPLALTLQYRRALSGEAIAERSLHEMRRGGPIAEAQARHWLDFMKASIPDVAAGDRITGRWWPESGKVSLQVNDGPPRELTDSEFGTRFFGIWLAPHSSQPELRARLLGLS